MKTKNFVRIFGMLLLFTITGCYPEGIETREEPDLIVTDHKTDYEFSTINTY